MKDLLLIVLTLLFVSQVSISQNSIVEGYIFEDGNRGYLNQVTVKVFTNDSEDALTTVRTNQEGFFSMELPSSLTFRLQATKDIFEKKTLTFKTDESKVFLKVPMMREEGYLFEVTLAPRREDEDQVVDAITGALIEVYNNTTEEEVLVLEDHPSPDFKVHFKKGNHYTVMVRKAGYLVKRMEAFVNVEGCILCFEGVGEVKPGVADNLTEGMSMGTLLANVELEPLYEGKIIELQNVYYEFGSAELTRQAKDNLRNLASIMKDNPHLNVELGSHTDVRGSGPDNRALSERRAASAVEFLTTEQGVDASRIIAKGYGESQIKNKCKAGVTCTDEEHAENRRTEIKILELDESAYPMSSLAAMKVEEKFMQQLMGGEGLEQVRYEEKDKIIDTKTDEQVATKHKEAFSEEEQTEMENQKERLVEDVMIVKQDNKKESVMPVEEMEQNEASVKDESVVKNESMVNNESMARKQEKPEIAKEKLSKVAEKKLTPQKVKKPMSESKDQLDKQMNSDDGFSGYRIVVHYSNVPISGDHEIYKVFDEVESYKTQEKNMLYMVGEFVTLEEAKAYKAEMIAEKYPNSYVVGFLRGQKINIE